jgi:excisionase family DNA binding protein
VLEDEMLTIDDLAAYLKLKPQTIYKWAQTGKIPGAKFGKEWRFRRSSIERWIDSYIPVFEKPAAVSIGADGNSGDSKATAQRREDSSPGGAESLSRTETGAKGVPGARLVSSREADARSAGSKGAAAGEGGAAAARPRKSAKLKKKPRGPESN